jgi:putative ABC transport system permease protein
MLLSYLTIAWRTLRKRFGTTVINVVGLSVGLAACLLIGLWVQHELSFRRPSASTALPST